jgi:hypothetical protein
MGQGGAPEGVLAAAALRCVGGQFKGRLVFRNDDEKARAKKWGITDLNKIYDLTELAKGDCIFAASGVTDGSLLDGVKRKGWPHDHRKRGDARQHRHRALGEGRPSGINPKRGGWRCPPPCCNRATLAIARQEARGRDRAAANRHRRSRWNEHENPDRQQQPAAGTRDRGLSGTATDRRQRAPLRR